ASHHRGHHFNALQGGHVARQRGVDGVHLVQVEVHAFFGLGAFARLGDGDGVRATHAQAARVVAARGIGRGAADRARLGVGDGDFGTGHRRTAVVGDKAADAGRGALGKGGGGRKGRDKTKGEL